MGQRASGRRYAWHGRARPRAADHAGGAARRSKPSLPATGWTAASLTRWRRCCVLDHPIGCRPTELVFLADDFVRVGLTDRLTRLQRAGLICRSLDTSDARSLPVQLTEEGKRVAEAAFREDMAVEARLLEGLSHEDLTRLGSLLEKLALSIEAKSVSQK